MLRRQALTNLQHGFLSSVKIPREDLWMRPLPSSSHPKKTSFLEHLNSIDEHIKFTCEEPGEDGSIPFLDILIIPNEEGSLKTTVYRKPTLTDLYLQWDSNHRVSSKYSVVGSLQHRANTICSNPELLQHEGKHLKQALTRCKYPAWVLYKVKIKTRTRAKNTKKRHQ